MGFVIRQTLKVEGQPPVISEERPACSKSQLMRRLTLSGPELYAINRRGVVERKLGPGASLKIELLEDQLPSRTL